MITDFGTTQSGQAVEKITLANGPMTVSILTWGAVLQDVRLDGVGYSLTLGSGNLADYEGAMRYHGSLIGPIVNRISTGRVLIDGMMYELERNQDNRIHLHSGEQSTLLQVWKILDQNATSVTLGCDLMDGQCGLPGNRSITATYTLEDDATLRLTISGTTDTNTLMNFANHSYWNLDGTDSWSGHKLGIQADAYLPTTVDATPTGDVLEVAGTAMDYRKPRQILAREDVLDHNLCLSTKPRTLNQALVLIGQSDISLTISTDQTGIQVYDGRDAIRPGKDAYEGLAIEAQSWPDAPSHSGFPSIEVTPDAPYSQETTWTFTKP